MIDKSSRLSFNQSAKDTGIQMHPYGNQSIVTLTNILDEHEEDENVCKVFLSGIHGFVEIISKDLWLNTKVRMSSSDFANFESQFEIKIDRNIFGKDLRMIMQKLLI